MKADEYIAQARALEARGESDREIVQAVALLFVKEASALTAQRAGARGAHDGIAVPVLRELRGLRWANVDERRMVVAIVEQRTHQDPFDPGPPKTASGIRDLPITAELLELARAAGGADLVFPSKAGTPFNDRTLRKHLNDAIAAHHREHAALTIPDFRVHDFRHTCASNILRLGCSLDYERALLGHAPEHITAHYARPDAEVLRPWIERWSRVVLGLPPPAAARAPDEPLAQ